MLTLVNERYVAQGDHYTDKMSYAKTQKEKKKGFLTGDFRRRDEFSNTLRTLQYRELLELEDKHRKKATENMSEFQEMDAHIKEKLDREAAEKAAKHKGVRPWPPTGYTQSIFSVPGLLLATSRAYSP
jgi:hypothetical protein